MLKLQEKSKPDYTGNNLTINSIKGHRFIDDQWFNERIKFD